MLAFRRRMIDHGAVALQQFGQDVLPLILLFAISVTGLLLTASYTWMKGYAYDFLAILHAVTVIFTLLWLPFGKFFHIFQRPAQLGVSFYKDAGAARRAGPLPALRAAVRLGGMVRDLDRRARAGLPLRDERPTARSTTSRSAPLPAGAVRPGAGRALWRSPADEEARTRRVRRHGDASRSTISKIIEGFGPHLSAGPGIACRRASSRSGW